MFSTQSRGLTSALSLLSAFVFWCAIAATTTFAAETDGVITTLAGTGTAGVGGDGGAAKLAQLNGPQGAAVDAAGNVYIADVGNNRIRKVAAGTGIISTFAGTGTPGFLGDGGLATAARLYGPTGVAVDGSGNVYIADYYNSRIRRVAASTGVITTVAGSATTGYGGDSGPATAAQLYYPFSVNLDSSGNIYIADTNNHRVRKVTAATGIITTIAGTGTAGYNGDGPATGATLYNPSGVAVDVSGNVYIADRYNYRVRKVTAATGIISTVVGTGTGGFSGEAGPGINAQLNQPLGGAIDSAGNLYFADYYNQRIRKLIVATGIVSTVAGSGFAGFEGDGGMATAGALQYPTAVAVDGAGAMYIADYYNHRVRKVAAPTVRTLVMTTVAGDGVAGYNGDGPAVTARLYNPRGVAVDGAGNLYIADFNSARIRKVTAGVISTVAGTGIAGYTGEGGPATAARLYGPIAVAVDSAGNVYLADYYNQRIRKITVATGIITTIAGNGSAGFSGDGLQATTAQLYYPTGVAVDAAGNVYIADQYNQRIRKVTAATGVISTIAGTGTAGYNGDTGAATAAQLNYPEGVAVDAAGNVYVGDTNNHRVRKVAAATGVITSLAGTGTPGYTGEYVAGSAARLYSPGGLAVDGAGNVYIADGSNTRIRKVAAASGLITTVAGSGTNAFGGDGGLATAAQMTYSNGVGVDAGGTVYIADTNGHRVRRAAAPLDAPTSLTVVRSGAAARLSWTGSAGAVSYALYRGTAPGAGSLLASGIVGPTYLDTSIVAGTTYYYVVTAINSGSQSASSNEVSFRLGNQNRSSDFDGDGRADVTVYRPSNGAWYVLQSSTSYAGSFYKIFGQAGDVPVPGDYDGDGVTDIAVYRPSNGAWYILQSSTNFTASFFKIWGQAGDVPVAGDYDGDGKTDIAVYRPSNGAWYILQSSTNFTGFIYYIWGQAGDLPVLGDYDGDGKTDIVVYRPSNGAWYILQSSTNFTGFTFYIWGQGNDIPVQGDFDGDGKSDVVVYRPSNGAWYILQSSTNFTASFYRIWGQSSDIPVPGDFDGDGKTDIAIYRPSNGAWYVLQSSTNFTGFVYYIWGQGSDIPVLKRP